MKLSILICSLYERKQSLSKLVSELQSQIGDKPVEILTLIDNRKRSTGNKRQALLTAAQGEYLTFLDDDDWVSERYIEEILGVFDSSAAGKLGLDVICLTSEARIDDGNPFNVSTALHFPNEQVRRGPSGVWQDIRRMPWHWCVWRSAIAKCGRFPDAYIDDDWFWLRQIIPLAKTQVSIKEPLHFYRYNSKTSASRQGKSVTDGTL